jgi:rubrerythrin
MSDVPQPAKDDNNFYKDPNDIDLSAIEKEIIDTSRGDKINYENMGINKVHRLKCLNCGFMYEGKNYLEVCPRCGSTNLDDSDSPSS